MLDNSMETNNSDRINASNLQSPNLVFTKEELARLETMEFSLEINNFNCGEKIQVLVPPGTNNTNDEHTILPRRIIPSQIKKYTDNILSMMKNPREATTTNVVGKHSRLKHTKPKMHGCIVCSKLFSNKIDLKIHNKESHKKKYKKSKQQENTAQTKGIQTSTFPETNPFLNRRVVFEGESKKIIKSAIETEDYIPLELSPQTSNLNSAGIPKKDIVLHDQQWHICKVCTEKLPSKSALRKHVQKSHSRKKQHCPVEVNKNWYSCNICSAKLSDEQVMQRHIRGFHPGKKFGAINETMHGYSVCPPVFPDNISLSKHKKKKKSNKKSNQEKKPKTNNPKPKKHDTKPKRKSQKIPKGSKGILSNIPESKPFMVKPEAARDEKTTTNMDYIPF